MKQVQEEHLCRDIHKIALALEKIAKALPSAEQEAPDINVGSFGTISRQVAIDMLDEQIELCNASLHKGVPEKDAYAIKVERASLMAYREKLECLPFVQPERNPGRWIWQKRSYTFDGEKREILVKVCSYCGKPPIAGAESTYCPHCGEKKEGEWNDTGRNDIGIQGKC